MNFNMGGVLTCETLGLCRAATRIQSEQFEAFMVKAKSKEDSHHRLHNRLLEAGELGICWLWAADAAGSCMKNLIIVPRLANVISAS